MKFSFRQLTLEIFVMQVNGIYISIILFLWKGFLYRLELSCDLTGSYPVELIAVFTQKVVLIKNEPTKICFSYFFPDSLNSQG